MCTLSNCCHQPRLTSLAMLALRAGPPQTVQFVRSAKKKGHHTPSVTAAVKCRFLTLNLCGKCK